MYERLIDRACITILEEYSILEPEISKKSLNAWRPVVFSVISAVNSFPDLVFEKHLSIFYKPMAGIILQAHDQAFREALNLFFMRCAGSINMNMNTSIPD